MVKPQALFSKWIQTLNNAKQSLIDMQAFEVGERGVLHKAQAKQALMNVRKVQQEVATEVQKTGLTKANKEVQEVYAKILKPIKDINGLSEFMLLLGAGTAVGAGSKLRGVFNAVKSPKLLKKKP